MKANRINGKRLTQWALFAFAWALALTLPGCAYRLPAARLPSQQRLRVVANSPEHYVLRLRIRESHEYRVPSDGRVTLDIPGYRAACSVYLFGVIRVQRGASPFTARTMDVLVGGKIVRRLSLKGIAALPADGEGYHLLTVRAEVNRSLPK